MNIEKNARTPHWGECILDHYEKHLGKCTGSRLFEHNKITPFIRILSFDNIFVGCRAFCSFGFSNYARVVGEVAEVFMPVDDGWDKTPELLAGALFNIAQHDIHMGWGIGIRFADAYPEFAHEYGKTAFYIAVPFGVPEDFYAVRCDSETAKVYMACYITDFEYNFFRVNGANALETQLQASHVDVFHIGHPSSI